MNRSPRSSHRPNSLTRIAIKVFERILIEDLSQWLRLNHTLGPIQHGFLPAVPCSPNMPTVMGIQMKAYDHSQISHAAYVDFAKIHNRVPHIPLFHELRSHGVVRPMPGIPLSFVTGYGKCWVRLLKTSFRHCGITGTLGAGHPSLSSTHERFTLFILLSERSSFLTTIRHQLWKGWKICFRFIWLRTM